MVTLGFLLSSTNSALRHRLTPPHIPSDEAATLIKEQKIPEVAFQTMHSLVIFNVEHQ